MDHYSKAENYLSQLEGKAFWPHLAAYAAIHALLAIVDTLRQRRPE